MSRTGASPSWLAPFAAVLGFACTAVSALAGNPAAHPVDRSGGGPGLIGQAAGHFRVDKSNGRWWLFTPEGHGMILLGVNHLSEMKNPKVHAPTVLGKRFGSDWTRVFAEVERQCREWGFNSAGFEAPKEMRASMPHIISTPFMGPRSGRSRQLTAAFHENSEHPPPTRQSADLHCPTPERSPGHARAAQHHFHLLR